MSELDKIFLPLVGTFIIGVLTWFLNTLLKLRQEFDTHREGKGHKLLVDAFFELDKDVSEGKAETEKLLTEKLVSLAEELNKLIAQLDKRVEVNLTKIDSATNGLQSLAGTTKYNVRSLEDRLFLVEEILKSNGYTILNYNSRRKTLTSADKDTFTQIEEMGEGDVG